MLCKSNQWSNNMNSITYKCITSKICLQPFADFWGLCEAYNANVVTNNIRQLLGIDIGVLEPHAGMTLQISCLQSPNHNRNYRYFLIRIPNPNYEWIDDHSPSCCILDQQATASVCWSLFHVAFDVALRQKWWSCVYYINFKPSSF